MDGFVCKWSCLGKEGKQITATLQALSSVTWRAEICSSLCFLWDVVLLKVFWRVFSRIWVDPLYLRLGLCYLRLVFVTYGWSLLLTVNWLGVFAHA